MLSDKAQKHADMVALEYRLLKAWYKSVDNVEYYSFSEWLEDQLDPDCFYWKQEAKQLIAWYESK